MSGETTVGAIVGSLRLNIIDFEAGIAKAMALAEKLDGKDVNVQVKAETSVAQAKLAGVAAAEDKVAASSKQMGNSQHGASGHTRALVTALLTVGPALVPLAAGTVGLAAGFGGMGAAGVLAIVGISKEMKSGSAMGLAYTGTINTLKGNLTTLSRTAAAGVLSPFQASVASLQTKMPVLNSIIGDFSGITGRTAGSLTTGLVAAFISLEPLMRDTSIYTLGLSTRFAALMSGPGVVSFGDYVRSVFPQVMQSVESIVSAALRLVAALAPLGLGTLGILRTLSDVINALPVDVLAALAQTAGSVYLGFKTFGLLSGGITGVGTALKFAGISAETAAAGVRTLTLAAGAIGVVIAVATFLFAANAESTRKSQQAIDDYADALRRSNGVIDESIKQTAFKTLQDQGAIAAAKALGINLGLVTDAATNQGDALSKVNAVIKDARINHRELYGATQTLSSALSTNNTELSAAVQKNKDLAEATKTGATATDAQTIAQQALAVKVGTTVTALSGAKDAQQKTADAAANAAAKMYMENDAAGLLRGTLDLLNGKALSAAQAQNSFDSSLANMGDHVNATGKKITFTTTSLRDMSAASVSLRGQLNGQIGNLQQVVEANGGLANSTGKAREQMVTMRQQIIDNAVAHGVDKKAVTDYVDRLLSIPKTVPPTKLDADTASPLTKVAALQGKIDAIKQGIVPGLDANSAPGQAVIAGYQKEIDRLHGKAVEIKYYFTRTGSLPTASGSVIPGIRAIGGLIGRAGGGLLRGPGTGTSDSIMGVDANGTPIARVSNKEFVVNAESTAKNLPLLQAINAMRNGGVVGLAAGGLAGGGFAVDRTPMSSTAGARTRSTTSRSTTSRSRTTKAATAARAAAAKKAATARAAAARKAAAARAAEARKAAAALKSLQSAQRQYQYTYLPNFIKSLGGTTSALAGAGRTLIAEAAKTTSVHQMSKSMLAGLSRENASLGTLATSRDSIAAQLASANTVLADAQQQFATEQANVTSTLGAFNLLTAGLAPGHGNTPFTQISGKGGVIDQLTKQVSDAAAFGTQIKTLGDRGLNQAMLKQLAEAGPNTASGSPISAMLASTPEQITQINTLMGQLQATADTTGTGIATSLYGAGVQSAQGLVDGLTSQQSNVETAMKTLADAMVAQVKKSLGIHSPSTVTRGVGLFAGQGVELGLADSQAGVVRAAAALARAAVPAVYLPRASGSLDDASAADRAAAVSGPAGGSGQPAATLHIEHYEEAHRPPNLLAADLAFLLRTAP